MAEQTRTNRRTGEVQAMRDGQWVTITPPRTIPGQLGPAIGGNPLLPGQEVKQGLEIAGSQLGNQRDAAVLPYVAPKAREDLRGTQLGNTRTAQDIKLDQFKSVSDLKQRFDADANVQGYREAIKRIAAAMKQPDTPAGDTAIIYNFGKVMDPSGSVQQGEQDAARAGSSLIAQAQSYAGMVAKGKRLPPETRKALLEAMRQQGIEYNKAYGQVRDQYRALAETGGFDPKLVIGNHDGDPFFQTEQDYKRGKAPPTPAELDKILNEMVAKQTPAADIRKYLKEVGSTIPPYQEKFLDAYEGARASGKTAAVQFRTLPGGDVGMGLAKGALHVWDRAAQGVENGINYLTGANLDDASEVMTNRAAYFAGQNVDPTAEMVGKIGAGGFFAAPFGGPVMQGALGNVLAGDETDSGGIATDAVLGGIGGKVGDMAVRSVAGLIAPKVDPAVKSLAAQGVKLRPGRMFGGTAAKREDLLQSYPIVGPRIDALADRELSTLAKVQPNRALAEIGQSVPDDVAPGFATNGYTRDAISNHYEKNLQGAQVGLDPTFITRLNYFGKRANLRPNDMNEFDEILQREVGGAFANGRGSMSGRDFKRLDEKLGTLSSGFAKMDDPYKRQIGDGLGFVNEQLRALVRRQNPNLASGLREADRAFAQYVPFERAAAMAPDGIPTPGQMRTASRANDMSRRKGLTARGEATMQDLATEASQVLPASRGNSGTADRLNQTNWKAYALGGLAAPFYSQPAVNALEKVMLRNPGMTAQITADALRSGLLPRGMFGAALPAYVGSGD